MNTQIKKKETLKSFLKSFTLYQKIFLAAVVLLTAGFVIFFPDQMLEEEYMKSTFLIICSFQSKANGTL